MGLRCKKGDLAMVIYGNRNLGAMVKVLEPSATYLNTWRISVKDERLNPVTGCHWVAEDRNLLPIRPGDLKETEETEKEMTV